MRRFLVVALVGMLAACGSSSSSSSSGKGGEYVDAMMKSYDTSNSGVKDVLDQKQAKCIAEGTVDAVGADTLESAGLSPSDVSKGDAFSTIGKKLSVAQAKDLVEVFTNGKCFSFSDLVIKEASAGSNNAFGKLSKTKVRCLFDKLLAEQAFKDAMVNSMLGRASSSDAFSKAFGDQSKLFTILSDCKIQPSELG
jgi:hypothetical protein